MNFLVYLLGIFQISLLRESVSGNLVKKSDVLFYENAFFEGIYLNLNSGKKIQN